MTYNRFKRRYEELESEVLNALRREIQKSKIESKEVNTQCIKVDIYGYVELIYIHDKLTFVDSSGLHYSLWAECSIEDLIDILNKI